MRKISLYIIIGAAIASLASCSRSEADLRDRTISFSPAAAKTTKAIIDGTTFPADSSFVVSAVHTEGTYFQNLVASRDTSTGYWITSVEQYWPLSGQLDFYAYAPSGVASLSGATISFNEEDGIVAEGYTCDGTTDFLYAGYTVADCSGSQPAVPLTFSHALSQVVIKVKQSADYTAEINNKSNIVTIKVDSLSLENMYVEADFVQLPNPSWSTTQESDIDGLEFNLGSGLSLTYGAADVQVGRLLTIPQTLGSVKIHTVYTITQTITDNSTSVTEVKTFTNPVDITLSQYLSAWECGKKYVYVVSYGLDPVEVSATTVDWVPSGGEIIVEEE